MAAYPYITVHGTGQMPWNFYNSFIQVLMTTGLPGLALVLLFLALMLYRGLRFFSVLGPRRLSAHWRFRLLATMPYFMLEAGLFSAIDIRTLFYFLMCGMTLGAVRECG